MTDEHHLATLTCPQDRDESPFGWSDPTNLDGPPEPYDPNTEGAQAT